MRSAGTKADNVLKEYEHVFKMLKNVRHICRIPKELIFIITLESESRSIPVDCRTHS